MAINRLQLRHFGSPGRLTILRIIGTLLMLVLLLLSYQLRTSTAEDAPRVIDFERQVFPILQRSCIECHGREKQEGGLRLDGRQEAIKGGDSGAFFQSGRPDDSEIIRRVMLPKGDSEVMPARGEPLAKREIEILRLWIQQGAKWPDNAKLAKHWAYVKPSRTATLPSVTPLPRSPHPIDVFVLARLEKERLSPAPQADRATLIRRLSFDLVGLPPTPTEVESFLTDNRPDAYERLVDRLLASPHYGERWARPWLDLARYADSHGFQKDDLRELWAYRDWVVHSLNADMPFDQFTVEQMAGDLLPNATEAQKIATGFHRCTMTNVEAGSDPEETRTNQVLDRVNTTAAVWLGTTLECAQCHDHKYDPFSQREYYQLFAFFNNTVIEAERANPNVPGSIKFLGPRMTLSTTVDEPKKRKVETQIKLLERQIEKRREELSRDLDQWLSQNVGRSQTAPETHVLEIDDFDSSEGSPHKLLDDKSVLLVDDAPDRDTYVIHVNTKLRGITGFKIEALTDPSLPGNGPGRGDADRPNFVLNSFIVTAIPLEEVTSVKPVGGKNGRNANKKAGKQVAASRIKFTSAQASFSQANYQVTGAIDNDGKSGWAINPKFHQTHWATFSTDQPIGFEEGTHLTFTLVQEYGGGRTIGRLRLSALTGTAKNENALPSEIERIVALPREKRSAKQIEQLITYRLERDSASTSIREKLDEAKAASKAARAATTLVMEEMPNSRSSSIFLRGDFRSPGPAVEPGAPSVLHAMPSGPANRLTFARWLVDRENPLTARVTVNRWWAEIFGRGLVSTMEDFGIKGEPATHPELLDWLAVELMDNGWSMKELLRTIVLSTTYQQSSYLTPELLARDPQNELLARGPRFRLDAETIRDNALSLAGLISLKQGGPPVRPYQPDGLWTKVGGEPLQYVVSPGEDAYRRGVYVVWKRAAPYPSFVNFDANARLACTVKRSRSNTPLQALTLLNDPVYVEAAKNLAKRLQSDFPLWPIEDRLHRGWQLTLGRLPKGSEIAVLRALYDQQREAYPKDESAAWYAIATTLLNLDETITKH